MSLPTFRHLLESPLVIHTSSRISRTLRFSRGGAGCYFTNPNQVQKFSVNKEEIKNLYESYGRFYQVSHIIRIEQLAEGQHPKLFISPFPSDLPVDVADVTALISILQMGSFEALATVNDKCQGFDV